MKHFFNPEMRAFNVMIAPADPAIVREFEPLCSGSLDEERFDTVTPRGDKWQSDIRWISARTPESFRMFEDAFHRLGIPRLVEDYVDIDKEIRLFFGQVIVRSRCEGVYLHTDWSKVNNEAFTFLTPVFKETPKFGLLYQTCKGEVAEYCYTPGEAILFGDFFRHGTKPGQSDEPEAVLCFEFGTDRMEHWDKVFGCMKKQARTMRKPNGDFIRNEF